MKKILLFCILSMCCSLLACAKTEPANNASAGIPDDLVVVLPDDQELYLYMPHDDAAGILGPADSTQDIGGKAYVYDELSLIVEYKDNLLANIIINDESPCHLKSGLSPSSGKSDFVKHGFSEESAPNKLYLIENGHYIASNAEFELEETSFQSAVTVGSSKMYESADNPNFKGYTLYITDYYCAFFLDFDE